MKYDTFTPLTNTRTESIQKHKQMHWQKRDDEHNAMRNVHSCCLDSRRFSRYSLHATWHR